MPAGPWRGQARVAIIDYALEANFDFAAATEQAIEGAATLAKAIEAEAQASWNEAALDIHFRMGLISLADSRYDAAIQAFNQMEKSLAESPKTATTIASDRGTLIAGLERLKEVSAGRIPLLPEEVAREADAQTATVLSYSVLNLAMQRYENAQRIASRIGVKLGSGARRSFAAFVEARAHIGLLTSGQATSMASDKTRESERQTQVLRLRSLLQQSLRDFPTGSWHDETLRAFARFIEYRAEERFGAQAESKDQNRSPQSQAKALLGARGEALPYWLQIVERHPKSPRSEEAMYRAGLLLCEALQVEYDNASNRRAEEAGALFNRLMDEYPNSVHAGDIFVHQIDIALEWTFELEKAAKLARRGVQWASSQDVKVIAKADGGLDPAADALAADVIKASNARLPAWAQSANPEANSLLDDMYNLYLRAGILAYLEEDYEEAARHFESAGPARPVEGMQANFDLQKVGLFILSNSIKRKQVAWYPEAIAHAKSDQLKLAIKLADTYLHAQRPEKAQAIYERLLSSSSPTGRPDKAVESYCSMQLALACSNQDLDYDKSKAIYDRFYQKDYAVFPWAADAIMRLSVLEFNTTQDPRRSISHYQHILKLYPNHPDAERALYFLVLDAVAIGDERMAESASKLFEERYPRSGWRNHVHEVLRNNVPNTEGREKEQD